MSSSSFFHAARNPALRVACLVSRKFAYEFVDEGWGFYRFHHHHMHISFNGTSQDARSNMNDSPLCITKDCDMEVVEEFYEDTC